MDSTNELEVNLQEAASQSVPGWRRLLRSLPTSVLLAVVLATAIRVILVFHGQYISTDEHRYDRALSLWEAVAEFNPPRAVTHLFKSGGRPGFVANYVPPALIQWCVNKLGGFEPIQTSWIPALYTVLWAAINIILIWKISIRLWGSRPGSEICAIVFAFTWTGLVHTEFLIPSITAQTYFLFSLLVLPTGANGPNPWKRFTASGVLFGMAFATYPGYYDQAPTLLLVALVLWWQFSLKQLVKMLWVPVGVVVTLGLWELISHLGWGPNYLDSLWSLKDTINNGNFDEVWKFPAMYLWHTDHLWTAILLVGLVGAVARLATTFRSNLRLAVIFLALPLWYSWHVLDALQEKSVLYGRLVFILVPVLCLIAGVGLTFWFRKWLEHQRFLSIAAVVISLWAFWNVWPFLQTTIPTQFKWHYLQQNPDYQVVAYVTSIVGTYYMDESNDDLEKRLVHEQEQRPEATTPVVLANVAEIIPVRGFREPPDKEVLAEAWHHLNLPGTQLSGYTREGREVLRQNPLRMMIVKAPPPAKRRAWLEQWGGYKAIGLEEGQ